MGLFYYNGIVEVMAIYEIYIDIYFVENLLLDMLVLLSVSLLLGKRPVLWRFLAASILGGAGAVIILCMGISYGIGYILSVLALNAAMCLILFADTEQMFLQVAYLQGLSFIYTKLGDCVEALGITRFSRLGAFALLAASALVICRHKRKREKKRLYEVRIIENGKEFDFKALCDTGNLLADPYTGKPVSVIEENADVLSWLRDKPHKYKLIPFRSIGEDNGLLEGTEVDELIISTGVGQKVERGAVIALYKGRLSGDGSFQMILNQGLF